MDSFEFMIPILVTIGIAVFLILLRCCCQTKTTDQELQQLQQQQQQQQHRVANSGEIFSIYPTKPELDPPPSYESVMMSQRTTETY